jgi:hypothetical protein
MSLAMVKDDSASHRSLWDSLLESTPSLNVSPLALCSHLVTSHINERSGFLVCR